MASSSTSPLTSPKALTNGHTFTPFAGATKELPPPLANSTPKKSKHAQGLNVNGAVRFQAQGQNGPLSPKQKRKSNGVQNVLDSPTPKKRKTVYMEDSDEEDLGASFGALSVNGKANGVLNGSQKGSGNKTEKEKARFRELQAKRKELPIARGRDRLISEIKENETVVLLGETGSGKTTQVPQYILESGLLDGGMIAITQPRRVAATTLASRVAQEQGVPLGKRVGYAVRFDEAWDAEETRIKFVTDGMMMRELLSDPLLSRYSVIIIDEAHERTLNTDILIASLKTIQQKRRAPPQTNGKGKGKAPELRPLKLVIMSATLDAEKFSRFYNSAKVLYVKGRQHPVTIYHASTSQADYVDSALRTFFQIHVDSPPGDVLIFLPGQEDIESLEKAIALYAAQLPTEQMKVVVCPMFASLPQNQQARVFKPTPAGARKCILATNIAETSITIPGVKYVIDTGKCKEKRHVAMNTGGGMDTLLTQDVCKSSAMQRAGRAGREGKGWCFRLYTEADFEKLPLSSVPEIQRCSLTTSMLQLKCLGLDMENLQFMDKPEFESIVSSLKTLWFLQALDNKRELTAIGRSMNNFPLDPSLSRALIASTANGCTAEVLDIVSLLSASSKLFNDSAEQRDAALEAHSKFRHPSGDHLTALNAFNAYLEIVQVEGRAGVREWCRKSFVNEKALGEAVKIREQLRGICERVGVDWKVSCGLDKGAAAGEEMVLKSLVQGMSQRTALLSPDGTYRQFVGHAVVKIHPGSTLSHRKVPVIMYDELVFTGSPYARGVSSIPQNLLTDLHGFSFKSA